MEKCLAKCLDVDKSAALVFPVGSDDNLELEYNLQPFRQVSSEEFLSLFSDPHFGGAFT